MVPSQNRKNTLSPTSDKITQILCNGMCNNNIFTQISSSLTDKFVHHLQKAIIIYPGKWIHGSEIQNNVIRNLNNIFSEHYIIEFQVGEGNIMQVSVAITEQTSKILTPFKSFSEATCYSLIQTIWFSSYFSMVSMIVGDYMSVTFNRYSQENYEVVEINNCV